MTPEQKIGVYTAILNQSETNAPVATILHNTIGDIVWTRDSIGFYMGTLDFKEEETAVFTSTGQSARTLIGKWEFTNTISIFQVDLNNDPLDGLTNAIVQIQQFNNL